MSSDLDAVPGGVISLDDDLRIVTANQAMGDLVARTPADLAGIHLDELLSAPSRILFQTHVYPALKADGKVAEVFLTLATSSGATVPTLLNAAKSSGSDGSTYQALVVQILARSRWETDLLAATRAIAVERAASQRLADDLAAAARDLAARHAEEQRNRVFRDAFIGVISHELRTPITTIYGMSHLLAQRHESMDPQEVGGHLADLAAASDRLRRLTEDLLVLSQAEGDGLQVAAEPIVIIHSVRRALEGERVRAGGHHLLIDAPAQLPLVLGDESYVEQVVGNFLGNAIKYSPTGTTVRVALNEEDGGVAVRVVDDGPGLRDVAPERLFDPFFRAPDAIREAQGAGIGLFVCRELVQAMGGRIWAAPAPGHGAEFGFWLPAANEEAL